MRKLTTAIRTAALLLALAAGDAPAQNSEPTPSATPPTAQDRATFDELYKDQLASAARTRSTADDLDLLEEMIGFAEQIPDDPGVQQLIYIEAIPLAARGGDIASMLTLADRLEAVRPGHEAASMSNLITLADRAYRQAPRDERGRVATPYIDLLLIAAERAAENDDLRQAASYARQANSIARSIDSERQPAVEARFEFYTLEASIRHRIEMLTQAVDRNPNNKPAARELVELLLSKRNDPVAANQYVELLGDAELTELVGLSAEGIEQASAATALRMGDWYVKLSEDQPDDYAQPLLEQARRWYARFLETYPRQDTLAQRVRSMDQVAAGRIERIAAARGPSLKLAVDPDGWVNLIDNPYDPGDHLIGSEKQLTVAGGVIRMDHAALVVPFEPAKAYELRTTVTVQSERDENADLGFIVHLPIGDTGRVAMARYYFEGPKCLRVVGVGAEDVLQDPPSRRGKKSELVFQVAQVEADKAAIVLLIDGEVAGRWQGPIAELVQDEDAEERADFGHSFYFNCRSVVSFHGIAVREREP